MLELGTRLVFKDVGVAVKLPAAVSGSETVKATVTGTPVSVLVGEIWLTTGGPFNLRKHEALCEGVSRVAQFLDEHGERLFGGAARAMAGGDAQRLRRGGQRFQSDALRDEP